MATNFKKLQNGSDIRGVALEGIPGEAVNLTEDEEDELISERNILERAEEIQENIMRAVASLYDSDDGASAYDRISEAQSAQRAVTVGD